eukprot:762028-Hanusia_phi.AAC.5
MEIMKEPSQHYANRVSPELEQDQSNSEEETNVRMKLSLIATDLIIYQDHKAYLSTNIANEEADGYVYESNPPSARSTMYSDDDYAETVWTDTLEVKQPEQWCKRYGDLKSLDGSVLGLENTCGPLQSCLDIGNPNYGFSSFDNMAVGQVLINVFLAVFANVFSKVRGNDGEPANDAGTEHKGEDFDEIGKETSGKTIEKIEKNGAESSTNKSEEKIQEPKSIGNQKADETSNFYKTMMIAYVSFQEQTKRKVPTSPTLSMVVRSVYYDSLLFLAIMTNSLALAMEGSLKGPNIICDGSLHKHFGNGEYIFEFIVTLLTTTALLADFLGASNSSTSVLRGTGILRLMRGLKFSFLRPIWLMLIKAVLHDSPSDSNGRQLVGVDVPGDGLLLYLYGRNMHRTFIKVLSGRVYVFWRFRYRNSFSGFRFSNP